MMKSELLAFLVFLILSGILILLSFTVDMGMTSEYRLVTPTDSQLELLEQGQGDTVKFVSIRDDMYPCTSILILKVRNKISDVQKTQEYFNRSKVTVEFLRNLNIWIGN